MASIIVRQLRGMVLALSFLTTLPVPGLRTIDSAEQGVSLLWYPLVGLLLGWLLTIAAPALPGPWYLQAGLLTLLWVVVTGGLHLDGLADCADAWLGGLGDRERTLELLKDPLCGTMGVLALVFVVLLKLVAVAALLQASAVQNLWLVLLLPRASLLGLFLSTDYVRAGGLGDILAREFSRVAAIAVLCALAMMLWLLLPGQLWLALLLTAVATLLLVRYAARRRLGGFTGDVAGALVEIQEVALLLVLVALVY